MLTHGIARAAWGAAKTWSSGRPIRQGVLAAAATAAATTMAWAWWPAGQYEPIQAQEQGTLISLARAVSAPQATARPSGISTPRLEPGTHLAVAMIPVDGATEEQPALLVLPGEDGDDPVVLLTDSLDAEEPTVDAAGQPEAPAAASAPTNAVALPFRLPGEPGPGGTQAVAVGTRDGAVTYKVAYAVVTVRDGAPVTNTNSALALASCNACTTVAVSVQLVLVVGTSNVIVPINAAGALNVNCPACVTVAIAKQLVITVTQEPSAELQARLTAALQELDTLPSHGRDLAAVVAEIAEVEQEIRDELEASGIVARPAPPTAPGTSTSTAGSTTTTGATTTTASSATTTAAATTTSTDTTTTDSTTTASTTTGAATTTADETTTSTTTTEPPPATTTTGG